MSPLDGTGSRAPRLDLAKAVAHYEAVRRASIDVHERRHHSHLVAINARARLREAHILMSHALDQWPTPERPQ